MIRLDDQLCFALYAAAQAIIHAYQSELAPVHLSYPQYLVMITLWQHGAAPAEAVAERLRLDTAKVVELVDQLEKSGYIHRIRSRTEQAATVIVLTQLGVQLEEAAIEAQRQVACRTGLTDEGLVALRNELHTLIDRLAASHPTPRQA